MKAHRVLVSAAATAMLSPALADNPRHEGYLVDSRNVIATSSTGQCWHTSDWTPALAVEPCDPVPRVARVAVAPAPQPEQAPPPKQQAAPAPVPVAPPPPKVVQQKVDLSADTLFEFDQAALQPEGRSRLDGLAQQLAGVQAGSVTVVGHADRIGPPDYNQKLSERRANTVKDYLASAANIPSNRINTEAKGSAEPVTRVEDCKGKAGEEAIDCLAPDRRVHVEVTGTKEVTQGAR